MTDEIKEKPLATLVPVIKSPELIKVKTISPKIVEALPWAHDLYREAIDWPAHEIVGHLMPSGILLRHKVTGALLKVGDVGYVERRSRDLFAAGDEHDAAIKQANEELAALPQIFPA